MYVSTRKHDIFDHIEDTNSTLHTWWLLCAFELYWDKTVVHFDSEHLQTSSCKFCVKKLYRCMYVLFVRHLLALLSFFSIGVPAESNVFASTPISFLEKMKVQVCGHIYHFIMLHIIYSSVTCFLYYQVLLISLQLIFAYQYC